MDHMYQYAYICITYMYIYIYMYIWHADGLSWILNPKPQTLNPSVPSHSSHINWVLSLSSPPLPPAVSCIYHGCMHRACFFLSLPQLCTRFWKVFFWANFFVSCLSCIASIFNTYASIWMFDFYYCLNMDVWLLLHPPWTDIQKRDVNVEKLYVSFPHDMHLQHGNLNLYLNIYHMQHTTYNPASYQSIYLTQHHTSVYSSAWYCIYHIYHIWAYNI